MDRRFNESKLANSGKRKVLMSYSPKKKKVNKTSHTLHKKSVLVSPVGKKSVRVFDKKLVNARRVYNNERNSYKKHKRSVDPRGSFDNAISGIFSPDVVTSKSVKKFVPRKKTMLQNRKKILVYGGNKYKRNMHKPKRFLSNSTTQYCTSSDEEYLSIVDLFGETNVGEDSINKTILGENKESIVHKEQESIEKNTQQRTVKPTHSNTFDNFDFESRSAFIPTPPLVQNSDNSSIGTALANAYRIEIAAHEQSVTSSTRDRGSRCSSSNSFQSNLTNSNDTDNVIPSVTHQNKHHNQKRSATIQNKHYNQKIAWNNTESGPLSNETAQSAFRVINRSNHIDNDMNFRLIAVKAPISPKQERRSLGTEFGTNRRMKRKTARPTTAGTLRSTQRPGSTDAGHRRPPATRSERLCSSASRKSRQSVDVTTKQYEQYLGKSAESLVTEKYNRNRTKITNFGTKQNRSGRQISSAPLTRHSDRKYREMNSKNKTGISSKSKYKRTQSAAASRSTRRNFNEEKHLQFQRLKIGESSWTGGFKRHWDKRKYQRRTNMIKGENMNRKQIRQSMVIVGRSPNVI